MHLVALFRGINVGGNNRLPMSDLSALLEGLGLSEVRTYIQSGNVVLCADDRDAAPSTGRRALAARIRDAIREAHGFAPHVLLLDADELRAAIRENPFPEAEPSPTSLHLFFLDTEPERPDLVVLDALRADGERFALLARRLYLHAPAGLGGSKLALKVERVLGVPATARNWNTIRRLDELARSLPCA